MADARAISTTLDEIGELLQSAGVSSGPIIPWEGPDSPPPASVAIPAASAPGLLDAIGPSLRARGWSAIWLGTLADSEALRAHHAQLGQPTAEVLRTGEAIDVDAWFEARREESLNAEGTDSADLRWMNGGFLDAVETGGFPRGPWPDGSPFPPIPLPWSSDDPAAMLALGLVPTPDSWAIPAHIQFGGWGECPLPAEWCALLRAWQRDHGAEIIGLTGASLELAVARPPSDRAGALDLARQHACACPEIFSVQFPHLEALAAALLARPRWRFRWD